MKTAGIVLFDDVEPRTFTDAVSLFCAEGSCNGSTPHSPFQPLLIAQSTRPVTCNGGFQIQPQATFINHPPLDLLLIPGARGISWDWPMSRLTDQLDVLMQPAGRGVRRERHNPQLISWVRDQSLSVENIVGVCSGAVLLAECGLLNGCLATTHPHLCRWMKHFYPHVVLAPERTLVDAGRVVTARGWNGAFHAALRIISRTHGVPAAIRAVSALDPGHSWLLPKWIT